MTLNDLLKIFADANYECEVKTLTSRKIPNVTVYNVKHNDSLCFFIMKRRNILTLTCRWPLIWNDIIVYPSDKQVDYNIDNLTEELVKEKIDNVEKQLIFLNEFLKKQKMYKRKQELAKDF